MKKTQTMGETPPLNLLQGGGISGIILFCSYRRWTEHTVWGKGKW